MTKARNPESVLPLTAVAFEILLSLAEEDRHGYHIMQAVEHRTGGRIILHAGTLYRALLSTASRCSTVNCRRWCSGWCRKG